MGINERNSLFFRSRLCLRKGEQQRKTLFSKHGLLRNFKCFSSVACPLFFTVERPQAGGRKVRIVRPREFSLFPLSQIKGKGRAGLARPRVESSDRFLLRPPLQSLASPPFPTDPGGKKIVPPLYLLCRFLGPSFFFSKRIRVTRSRNDRIKKTSPFSPLLSSDRPSMQVSFAGLATPSSVGHPVASLRMLLPPTSMPPCLRKEGGRRRRVLLSLSPPPLSGRFLPRTKRKLFPPPPPSAAAATEERFLQGDKEASSSTVASSSSSLPPQKKLLLQKSKISSPLREGRA